MAHTGEGRIGPEGWKHLQSPRAAKSSAAPKTGLLEKKIS